MVNTEYYLDVMSRLREAIPQKCIELWKTNHGFLHRDNSPAHTLKLVREFLAKNKTVIRTHPPYSAQMAPADFFLFLKLKTPMKGKRFATIEETGAVGDTKKCVSHGFGGLEKTLA